MQQHMLLSSWSWSRGASYFVRHTMTAAIRSPVLCFLAHDIWWMQVHDQFNIKRLAIIKFFGNNVVSLNDVMIMISSEGCRSLHISSRFHWPEQTNKICLYFLGKRSVLPLAHTFRFLFFQNLRNSDIFLLFPFSNTFPAESAPHMNTSVLNMRIDERNRRMETEVMNKQRNENHERTKF